MIVNTVQAVNSLPQVGCSKILTSETSVRVCLSFDRSFSLTAGSVLTNNNAGREDLDPYCFSAASIH